MILIIFLIVLTVLLLLSLIKKTVKLAVYAIAITLIVVGGFKVYNSFENNTVKSDAKAAATFVMEQVK